MSPPIIDHRANFLRLRAVRHEMVSRGAASYFCNPVSGCAVHTCRLRKCRRDRVCSGPMRPSAFLLERLHALHRLGLPSNACTVLPSCLAGADHSLMAEFEKWRDDWLPAINDMQDISWQDLARMLRYLRSRRGKAANLDDEPGDL